MYLQRLRYLDLRYRQECTKVIQRAWACYRQHKSTRATLQSRRTEAEEAWHKVQAAFLKDWDVISTEPRIVVHLPSLSLTEAQTKSTPYLNCQQNAQVTPPPPSLKPIANRRRPLQARTTNPTRHATPTPQDRTLLYSHRLPRNEDSHRYREPKECWITVRVADGESYAGTSGCRDTSILLSVDLSNFGCRSVSE